MRRSIIVAMLALAAPAGAQQVQRGPEAAPAMTGRCATAPLDLTAGIPVVEVMIGRMGPYRFGIDSGAQGHGRISATLAAALGLTEVGRVRTAAPGGTVIERQVFGVPLLSVGGVSFADVHLAELPAVGPRGPQLDGILGNGLFAATPLLLDYGKAQVRIGGAMPAGGVAVTFDHGVPLVPVTVAGKSFPVHLDTGNSAGALFLAEADARALPLAGPAVAKGHARTSFGEFDIMEAPLSVPVTVGTTKLAVNAVRWPPARPPGNLGSRGLAGSVVAIDWVGGAVAVLPSGKVWGCDAR